MVATAKRRNGHGEAAVGAGPPPVEGMGGPREPRVIQWIALDGIPEMRARVWLNHGWRVRQDLQSHGSQAVIQAQRERAKAGEAGDPERIAVAERALREVQGQARQRFLAAFSRVVLEHNGWCDSGGDPYPPASDPAAFWDALSTPLARTLMLSLYAEAQALANFPTPTPATTDAG